MRHEIKTKSARTELFLSLVKQHYSYLGKNFIAPWLIIRKRFKRLSFKGWFDEPIFLKGIAHMRRQSARLAATLLAFVIGFAALFYPVFRANAISVADYPEPIKIIQQEGRFIFTDGSSYYLLKKDGTFKSGPLGLSGREIAGTWKLKDMLFVIEGRWGWMNGVSPKDDYRRLTLYISTPEGTETVKQLSMVDGSIEAKVYKTYFEIEELQKIPKHEGTK